MAEIHARWLMTPGPPRGRSPRDTLLTGREHIDADLWSRCNQWSVFRACPPPLSRESAAFRFGPCGTHEYVLYYDMVPNLINNCWRHVVGPISSARRHRCLMPPAVFHVRLTRLTRSPGSKQFSRNGSPRPASRGSAGEHRLRRLNRSECDIPMKMSADDVMIDPDCPLCQMAADDSEFGPSFWHLDRSNMDQDYPFSFHATREAWEQEQREWEEHRRKFDEEWQAKQARKAAGNDTDDPPDADEAWSVSFSEDAPATVPLTVRVFSIGARLAELGQDLKQSADTQPYIDALNRHFGNLRAALQDGDPSLSSRSLRGSSKNFTRFAQRVPAWAASAATWTTSFASSPPTFLRQRTVGTKKQIGTRSRHRKIGTRHQHHHSDRTGIGPDASR